MDHAVYVGGEFDRVAPALHWKHHVESARGFATYGYGGNLGLDPVVEPDVHTTVYSMVSTQAGLFLGGHFSLAEDGEVQHAALVLMHEPYLLGLVDDQIIGVQPMASANELATVKSMLALGDWLVIGGSFSELANGQPAANLAIMDLDSLQCFTYQGLGLNGEVRVVAKVWQMQLGTGS